LTHNKSYRKRSSCVKISVTEGKSPNSLAIVINSVTYLYGFLSSSGLSTDVTQIGAGEMRAFILYLQQKRCFSNHPYSKAQQRGLSGHTINTYMRSIRAFWSWLVEEDIIASNLFSRIKIPQPSRKVITPFTEEQAEKIYQCELNRTSRSLPTCGITLS